MSLHASSYTRIPSIRLTGWVTLQIYLFGGVVTSWKQPSGDEVLFVRPDAKFDKSKPISGGIPHCFPQVGGPLTYVLTADTAGLRLRRKLLGFRTHAQELQPAVLLGMSPGQCRLQCNSLEKFVFQ